MLDLKLPSETRTKGAYMNCRWCFGKGCLCCDSERQRDAEASTNEHESTRRKEPQINTDEH